MKLYGAFDIHREPGEIKMLLEKMESQLNPDQFLRLDNFVFENFGTGRLYFKVMGKDKQPLWNEDKTKFIVMVGKVFDYEEQKKDLIDKGHIFEYPNSDAEFILHGFEEWGIQLIENLNGVFVFVLFDFRNMGVTIVNDRCGMKPLFYFHTDNLFIFASEVKAIIEDDKVKKEINWEAWRDLFSYGFMIGNKTPFKNIFSLPPATILNLTNSGNISLKKYWDYTQINVDHQSSENYFVSKGVALLKQAIQRQTSSLDECIVLLSGGYDSRFIASAIKYHTDVSFETFTTKPSNFLDSKRSILSRLVHCLDPIIAKEVAHVLNVKNTYIPRPRDLYSKHQIEKVFLLDGMCLEHLWILPVVDKLKGDTANFDGLAAGILLRGTLITEESLTNIGKNEKLAFSLDRQLQRFLGYPTSTILELFKNPIREKLTPNINRLTDELKTIGNHENVVSIFLMRNRTKNSVSLMSNTLVGKRAFCLFPFLDKDLVEFSLTIPPIMKVRNKICQRMLVEMFPNIMKIPSTTFFSLTSFKHWRKKYLFTLPLTIMRFLLKDKSSDEVSDAKSLLHTLDSLKIPEYLDIEKTKEMAHTYLSNGKDPKPFLAPIVEFCIWYTLFFKKTLKYSI